MEVKGIISSGMGKGRYFMSQDIYIDQFQNKLNFKPFVGTLNITIEPDEITLIMNIPQDNFSLVRGKGKLGDVKFIKAVLNGIVQGALVFPAKTKHTEDVLEFISNKNLRESLKLKDGDKVTVKID
jgi:riboflavin kinase